MYPIERKTRWLEKVGIAEFIDHITCSSALGIHKPDPAIYLDAMNQANLSPNESAFVGHAADELAGARRAGMATVAVNYDRDASADYHAETLPDLLNVPIFLTTLVRKAENMNHNMEVIFIDVGATLRVLVEDPPYQEHAKEQIAALVGTTQSPDAFCAELDKRYKVYRKWAFETLREASERELWTRWLLPDYPEERIGPLAGELTFLYRKTMGRRFAQPDAKDVVIELTRRGYRLGIISNTITEREIPQWLEHDGLSQYFPTVVLSSIYGHRKPGPEIYLEATRQANVHPGHAVYVGDNPIRDVVGAREAGFGMVIIMPEPGDEDKLAALDDSKPDAVIEKLSDLLNLFPARPYPGVGA
jgi:HAD superfamily hydrolase (TIGR01662 family)